MVGVFDSQFWESEEALLWEAIAALYLSMLLSGMEGGIDILPSELQTLVNFDVLNTDAIEFAQRYRYDLISKINATTRTQVQEAVSNWVRSGDSLKVLESQLAPIFGKNRAARIASTETTRAFFEGNKSAWESTGFVTEYRFNTAVDDRVCPLCSPRDGMIYKLGGFEAPPIHVGCRCFATPVVNVDAVAAQVEQILNA